MNFFELINKCLVELNYKQCDNFSDLVKNDHKKIKNILNIINAEVCNFDNWNFLLRKISVEMPKQTGEIYNSIEGRIHSVYINNEKYNFFEDFEKFFMNKQPVKSYSVFNDKILLPMFDSDKTVDIIYYTNHFAQNEDCEDISTMQDETDFTIIPFPYAEPLLIYGTCMRLKANTQYSKFSYWYGMYKEALANLRSKVGINALATPAIKLQRR